MYSYIARRLAFGALTVVGVSIMVFVVMRILPGDPLVAIFGPEGFTKLSDKERAHYMAELGLSDPLWVQYLAWVKDILPRRFRPLVLPLRKRRRHDPAARAADRRDRPASRSCCRGWSASRWRSSARSGPTASADSVVALRQHPVPRGAGLLGRHADRARACCSGSAIARRWPASRCSPIRWPTCSS